MNKNYFKWIMISINEKILFYQNLELVQKMSKK